MSIAKRYRETARACLLAFNRRLLAGDDAGHLLEKASWLLKDADALGKPEVLS